MKKKKAKKKVVEKKQVIRSLSDKEKMFGKEYLVDLNGTQAAIRAGYSKKTAREQASRLLTKVNIQEYTKTLMEKRSERIEITADKVLQEVAKLAFSNMGDYVKFNEDGTVSIDLSKVSREQAAAIQEITVEQFMDRSKDKEGERVRRVKFKLADKKPTLELLGKHLKLFTEVFEDSRVTTLADAIKQAYEEVKYVQRSK